MSNKIAIITINKPSFTSAKKLESYLKNVDIYLSKKTPIDGDLKENHILFEKLDDILPIAWTKYDAIICILAIGAVVRKIAPLLKDKSSDPAVLVVNLELNKIVPLLSGHLGGANELAKELEKKLPNAISFISTATDQTNTIAFEMEAKERGWDVVNLKSLANISNRLLNNQIVKVATYKRVFNTLKNENLKLISFDNIDKNSVIISPFYFHTQNLHLKPKLFLGLGCNRGTSFEEIQRAVLEFLKKYNLSIEQVKNIASFESKKDEIGLLEFAKKYGFKIKFFKKDEINCLKNDFSSSQATNFFGIKGVAEPASILVSNYKELLIKKESFYNKITIAGAI